MENDTYRGDSGPRPITLEVLRELLPPGSPPTAPPVVVAAAPPRKRWLQFWKPSDFTGFQPPADFVLAGDCHFTRGGITVLGGWPGVGKSRAALGLAVAGATGQSWLGHAIHARFRTLIIQAENGEWRLKQELTEALPGRDLDEWIRITPPPAFGLAFLEAGFRCPRPLSKVIRRGSRSPSGKERSRHSPKIYDECRSWENGTGEIVLSRENARPHASHPRLPCRTHHRDLSHQS